MTDYDVKRHIDIALAEIGPVQPWWSEEDNMYVFEHAAYPWVMHADSDPEETKAGYLRALTGFIEDRLNGDIADKTDETTPGHGGKRTGSGRPKGSVKPPTKLVRVPVDIGYWLKADKRNIERVRQLMQDGG